MGIKVKPGPESKPKKVQFKGDGVGVCVESFQRIKIAAIFLIHRELKFKTRTGMFTFKTMKSEALTVCEQVIRNDCLVIMLLAVL